MNVFELVADPVRLAIVRQLSVGAPAPLGEIAEGAGVHPNTVRSHMSELEASGVVAREHAACDGPGRPQVHYRLVDGWRLPSDDMRGLSELLAALVARLDPAAEDLDHFGAQWGSYLRGRPGGDAVADLPRVLERLGFDAALDGREVRLGACPCPLVSPGRPELICGLAAAAIDGIVRLGPRRMRVCGSQHDPDRRTCRIHLSELPQPV